jgi:lysozyme
VGLNVNDHHRLNGFGLELLTEYEKGPQDGSVPLTPGGAAMEPYICPGDMLTIGYGCTKFFGGMEVLPTDRLSDEVSARALLADQLIEYEAAVKRLVTVALNSNQFSALTCFAFNCGISALAGSTLLKHVNANRFDDAADQFGAWLYSTSGQHKQALRGLLRRRYSESCLWMGYSWSVACADDAVAMVRERPPGNIGTDKVLFKTKFTDVLTVAQRYPLPPLDDELVLTTLAPSPRAADEVAQRQASPAQSPAAGAAPAIEKPASVGPPLATPPVKIPAPQRAPEGTVVLPSQKVDTKPPEKPPIIAPHPINPNQLPTNNDTSKNMADSTRMLGMVLVGIGSVIQIISVRLGIGTAIGAVAFDLSRDPTVIALTVTAIIAAFGWATKARGKKTFAKGADKAQGNLY